MTGPTPTPDTMHLTRRRAIALGVGAALSGCARAGRGARLTLAEVIGRQTIARGGAAALDRVRRIAIDVTISEKGQRYDGRYFADAAGLVRINIYVDGKLAFREGIDSQGVWLWGGEAQARPSTAEGAANALLHGAEVHLFGLHRFAERGHKLVLTSPQAIEGVTHQVVECTFTTGHISYFYIDPRSWLVVRRRDERAYHPDVDPTKAKIETRFSDFVTVDGVVAAHQSSDHNLETGELLSLNQVTRRRLNPNLPPNLFDRGFVAPPTPA